jgi:hypothetical protein
MRVMQRLGVTAVAVALLLWVVMAVAVLTTRAEEGVNIGAVLIALAAAVVSIAGAVLLIASVEDGVIRALAAGSLVAWVVVLALTPDDSTAAVLQTSAAALGTVALCIAGVLTWRRRPRGR